MKIVFFDEQDAANHTANGAELTKLFQIAEKLSDPDLPKLERICQAASNLPDDILKKPDGCSQEGTVLNQE